MNDKDKKISTFRLAGLCAGPVLGSGIIFLPPMVNELAGDWSFFAWIVIVLIGIPFAYICSELVIIFPSGAGLMGIVGKFLGKRAEVFTSIMLLMAIACGPVIVIKTAGNYVGLNFNIVYQITYLMMFAGYLILMFNIKFFSSIQFFSSSLIVILLIVTSIASLNNTQFSFPDSAPDVFVLGRALLLLFWGLVGWEIIGNYSHEVRDPHKTIPRAVLLAVAINSFIMLIVAYNIQYGKNSMTDLPIVYLFEQVFGRYSPFIASVLVFLLCFSTFVMISGAGARLIMTMGQNKYLPELLGKSNSSGTPVIALIVVAAVQSTTLALNWFNIMTDVFMVKWANTFFICNILIILVSGLKSVQNRVLKISIIFVMICFAFFALFSSPIALIILLVLFTWWYRDAAVQLIKQKIVKNGISDK
ncbi:MAG: amino acid permease [Desulfobacteraceae bacterium]|nr:amino acid permease [Desulfobacteraceae bacterium]